MIRLADTVDIARLRDSHCSRVIKSHCQAYGYDYDFCRFFEITDNRSGRVAGAAVIFNSAMSCELYEGEAVNRNIIKELGEFIGFQMPQNVELSDSLTMLAGLRGYIGLKRRFYEVSPAETDGIMNPEPEAVFRAVYPNGADYGLWLTDTLRRVNRGLSRLYGYRSSVLTVRFMLDGWAYITDVATPPDDCGKGYARTLLGGVASILGSEGYISYLGALPETAEYYRSLGYKGIKSDRIYNLRE